MRVRIISILELTIIILSVISFSYFVSTDLPEIFQKESSAIQFLVRPIIPTVSASPILASGCCLENKNGAVCQEMLVEDSNFCKTDLIGTGCETVKECQKGCCYDSDSGMCTLNAPQEKCIANEGEWDISSTCEIPQCQVGCCLLGDGAMMTTSKECTQVSDQFRLERNFQALDSKGSCDAYSGLSEEGACLLPSEDFSSQKECIFTTKAKCTGEFKRGYLCTSKELNTNCVKTEKTSCFEENDRVYFLDSCNNKANVYDAKRAYEDSYWEKIIAPADSCQVSGASCGNCEYSEGSICTKYTTGRDLTKPTIGDNVCKNLNCANGKKHGESWCVSDSNSSKIGANAVGSRNYVAKCMDGEISIDGCADFNQEVCIENADNSSKRTEAKCEINDWRSCIYANDKNSYAEVEKACNLNPACIMFNDIPGNQKYSSLPGFKENVANIDQGRAGDVGKDMNKIITYCVPRYTPGYQFWSSASVSNPFSNPTKNLLSGTVESNQNYGGSKQETGALCSLGSFTCVSHIKIDTPLVSPSPKDMENPECNIDAVDQSNQKVSLMMEALNERCRSLGSCGMQYNSQGELGSAGFSVGRTKINKDGEQVPNVSVEEYKFTNEYLKLQLKKDQSSNPMGKIETLSQLALIKGNGALILNSLTLLITGFATTQTTQEAQQAVGESIAEQGAINTQIQQIEGGVGALAAIGAGFKVGTTAATSVTLGAGSVVQTTYEGLTASTTMLASQTVSSVGVTEGSKFILQSGANLVNTGTGALTGYFVDASGAIVDTFSVAPQAAINGLKDGTRAVITSGKGAVTPSGTSLNSIGAGLGVAAITAICGILGSYIGGMIAKSMGMSPGESTAFVGMVSALGSAGGVWISSYFGLCAMDPTGITCTLALIAAIIMFIYSAFTGEDNEYYITQFNCEAWEPPATGKCEQCNNDVRPCSEYKCRSLGNNCHYYVENGEPGYCASLADVWSATIKPWNEALTSGNKYSNVSSFGFKIINEKNQNKEVDAWKDVKFGIITDKEAICKLDYNHSSSFEEMQYTMLSEKDYATGKVDGMHHAITLSPHVSTTIDSMSTSALTPGMEQGDNEYYIKCKNFAGQINDAAFIVQVTQADGPDLTPAQISRFSLENNAYVSYGSEGSDLWMYVNEPAECRYSVEYDQNYYEDMPNSFSCVTNPSQGFYGEWPCYAFLQNLTPKTEIFIKCKDQPSLNETDLVKRVVNPISEKYTLNVCQTGLEIVSISPSNETIEVNSSAEIVLNVKTEGCINGGEAKCYYTIPEYGSGDVEFLKTGGTTHSQPLTNFISGKHEVSVECKDNAGNIARANVTFSVYLDDSAPKVTRAYQSNSKLILNTDEEAECLATQNKTIGCEFGFESELKTYSTLHVFELNGGQEYFIKCKDKKGNAPLAGCTEIVKLSDAQQ